VGTPAQLPGGDEHDDQRGSLLQSISAGLKQKPAYLLIFALSALFFLFGIGDAVAAIANSNPQLWAYAFGGLCFSMVAAVFVIFKVEQTRPILPPMPPPPQPEHESSGNPKFDEILDAIRSGVSEGLKLDNVTFHEAMLQSCAGIRAQAAEWSHGEIHVREQYNELLIKFYERAERFVFSTSIPGYLSAWGSPFGKKLMQAHRKSNAVVNRIFIFNNRAEVTDEALAIMQEQVSAGIHVRVHLSDESKVFTLPPEIGNDFTVIDNGEAIGVTIALGSDRLAATWYVQDKDRKQRFELTCDALIRDSEDYSQFCTALKRGQ
jgi:hypothetical protein